MVGIVSKKYAEALFKIGNDKKKLDVYLNEALDIKEIFEKEKQLNVVLCHPQLPLNCKQAIIKDAFEGKISKEMMGLFYLVLKKNRQEFIVDILDYFILKVNAKNNLVEADLFVADEIDAAYIEKIRKTLEKKVNKEVKIETKVDESLIAGFKIKMDNTMFDRSVASRIKNLNKAIIS